MSSSSIERMSAPHSDEATINILHPLFKEWFFSRFSAFSEPQKYAILNIHSRVNTLVSSPTGSGKTLCAFGAILNSLIDSADKGLLEKKVYAVYISPLKALSNDIHKNLLEPLAQINELAVSKGKEPFDIRVAVRTGDTTLKERAVMLKNPPHILVTTPESLSLLISTMKFREHLRDVEWCIIDEIHAIAPNKRGVHLSLTLELISHIAQHLCRIGLSATAAPLEDIAQFLVGTDRPCQIVDAQYLKKLDLDVLVPCDDLITTPYQEMDVKLYEMVDSLISQHKTTLIFTNTRAATERVVHTLKERFPSRYGDHNTGAHHGSLEKEHRLDIEKRLREGTMKVVACSTTLELGIDIGYIDLVICLGSPKSVARALQRIGRSGHALHETTKGRIILTNRDDLVECAVLAKQAREHHIDRTVIPSKCLDVLCQQVIALCLEQVWNETELHALITKSSIYKDLTVSELGEILGVLSGEIPVPDWPTVPRLWRKDGQVGHRGGLGRMIYHTNLGTIPDSSFIHVKIGAHVVGRLDEGFLERLKPNDIFVLGGATYQFKHAKGMTAQVVSAVGRKPTIPQWASEALPLSPDLAVEITRFRGLMHERLCSKILFDDVCAFVKDYLGCSQQVAHIIAEYFSQQYRFSKQMSTPSQLLVEHYEGPEESMLIFHTLYGRQLNECLGRAVKFAIEKLYGKETAIGISDNGFTVLCKKGINVRRAFEILHSEKLELLMNAALLNSEVFRRRFRACATRSLILLKTYKGHHKLAGQQQVSSMILLKRLREKAPDFFLLREARREVLSEVADLEAAKRILKQIEDETLRIEEFHTQIPTPFAFSLALQSMMDLLGPGERHEFLLFNHQMVLAKISLEEGKRKN